MYNYAHTGVYGQPDGSVIVAYRSIETRTGVRHLRLPAAAWAVIRQHYEAIAAKLSGSHIEAEAPSSTEANAPLS